MSRSLFQVTRNNSLDVLNLSTDQALLQPFLDLLLPQVDFSFIPSDKEELCADSSPIPMQQLMRANTWAKDKVFLL